MKFASPFIGYLKPVNTVRGYYMRQQNNQTLVQTKKQVKQSDQRQIAQTFYHICQVMNCRDPWIGRVLRELQTNEKSSVALILKKYD